MGKTIALAFARAGAHVVCVARTKAEVDQVADQIAAGGYPEPLSLRADVSCAEEVADAVACAKRKFGAIDVLINNAGIDRFGSLLLEQDMTAWWRVLEVNLKGPAMLTRQVLPDMVHRDSGTVISIGSRNAVYSHPFMTAYSASKTALLRFHQCLESELCETNVNTFYVQPGDVATSLVEETFNSAELQQVPRLRALLEAVHDNLSNTPDSPWLIANTCVMLAADKEARLLRGLYLDANQDLACVLDEARKGKEGQIQQNRLYSLKVDML